MDRRTPAGSQAGRPPSAASEAEAHRLHVLRGPGLISLLLVEDALGKQMLALLFSLKPPPRLPPTEEAVDEAFLSTRMLHHPGLGVQLGARVLAEIGDGTGQLSDARGLKAMPARHPSRGRPGKKSSVTRRWVKNDRLNHAGYLWLLCHQRLSRAKAHYRRRRDDHGDYAAAQRNLFLCTARPALPLSSRPPAVR
ncbi:putative Mini-circle transposase for [Streptomyces afghaniensis 772] [Streptomyces afghaniensis]